jgi:hypothetical protein
MSSSGRTKREEGAPKRDREMREKRELDERLTTTSTDDLCMIQQQIPSGGSSGQ